MTKTKVPITIILKPLTDEQYDEVMDEIIGKLLEFSEVISAEEGIGESMSD